MTLTLHWSDPLVKNCHNQAHYNILFPLKGVLHCLEWFQHHTSQQTAHYSKCQLLLPSTFNKLKYILQHHHVLHHTIL